MRACRLPITTVRDRSSFPERRRRSRRRPGSCRAGAKRVIPLKVSGPFHSAMLTQAGEKLGKVLETVEVHTPVIPYVANVTAEYVTDAADVKPLLVRQVSSSVRWEQSIRRMLENGVDTFIEIGPGRTLTGFMKKIDRNAKAMNIEKLEDIEKVKRRSDVRGKGSHRDGSQPRARK